MGLTDRQLAQRRNAAPKGFESRVRHHFDRYYTDQSLSEKERVALTARAITGMIRGTFNPKQYGWTEAAVEKWAKKLGYQHHPSSGGS